MWGIRERLVDFEQELLSKCSRSRVYEICNEVFKMKKGGKVVVNLLTLCMINEALGKKIYLMSSTVESLIHQILSNEKVIKSGSR